MKLDLLHLNTTPLTFSGLQSDFEEARFTFLGAPFDGTTTYRPGSRFGPSALREASLNIETYSTRSNADIETIPIHDLGDINVTPGDTKETVRRIKESIAAINSHRKLTLTAGGEHTVTLGAAQGVKSEAAVVFDAHGDLRDEYLQQRISHATVTRRMAELIGQENLVLVGVRAISSEELAFLKRSKVVCIWGRDIRREGPEKASNKLRDSLTPFSEIYVSVDLDILDPAYAPAVGNPEAEGTDPSHLIDLLMTACERKVVGIDIVELCPPYDKGQTAVLAARIAFELIAKLGSST